MSRADFIVTIDDVRKTGHCVRGIRRWFEAHRLDFKAFMQQGIAASVLLNTGDDLALDVVTKIEGLKTHG